MEVDVVVENELSWSTEKEAEMKRGERNLNVLHVLQVAFRHMAVSFLSYQVSRILRCGQGSARALRSVSVFFGSG